MKDAEIAMLQQQLETLKGALDRRVKIYSHFNHFLATQYSVSNKKEKFIFYTTGSRIFSNITKNIFQRRGFKILNFRMITEMSVFKICDTISFKGHL